MWILDTYKKRNLTQWRYGLIGNFKTAMNVIDYLMYHLLGWTLNFLTCSVFHELVETSESGFVAKQVYTYKEFAVVCWCKYKYRKY